MGKNKLSGLERAGIWASIISCIFVVLTYCSPPNGTVPNPSQEDSTGIVHLEKIRTDTTTWDKIFLPFIKHDKMNYHKHEWNEKGWRVYIGYLAIIGLLLIGILACGAHSLGYFDGAGSSGNLYAKIFTGIIAIVLLIYLILRILAQIGRF